MPSMPYRPGPLGLWPSVPAVLYSMSRDEIVQLLMDYGFSRKVAERDADAWIARQGGPATPEAEKSERNVSVSENGMLARLLGKLKRP